MWEALYKRAGGTDHGMYITTLALHPKSVGTIRLKSANRDEDPLIDPKLLHDSSDVQTLVDGELSAGNISRDVVVKKITCRMFYVN